MTELKEFANRLFTEKSVAVICHIRPDGDTVGSALGLKSALNLKNIKCEVFCDGEIPSRFFYLKGAKEIKTEFSGEFSAFLAIDCADLARLGKFAEIFSAQKNTYVLDHHVSNTRFAKICYVSETAANCENVYRIITYMGITLNQDAANALATGLVTDTGAFKHKNVTGETLRVAGELVDAGADLNKIIYYNFTEQSKARAQLFGKAMSAIRYYLEDKLAITVITRQLIKDCGAKEHETEGFVDFLMGVNTVEVGACVMETEPNKYKISLRSKGADVNAVAQEFGGGGHVLASGCKICGEIEEVIDKLRFAVYKHLPE